MKIMPVPALRTTFVLLAGWALLFSSARFQAQQAAPGDGSRATETLQVKARLVVLDVIVTDKSGLPVSDLKESDFHLYERGMPRPIRSFEAPALHRVPDSLPTAGTIDLRTLEKVAPDAPVTLIVLDELNSQYMDQAYSRNALKQYLDAQSARLKVPTSLLAVTESSTNQISGFTLDRAHLLEAAQQHKPAYPFQMMRTGNSPEGTAERFGESLASLQQVALATSGYSGRKNIVWIGPGFPSIDMRNLPEAQRALLRGACERTVNLLTDAHITLYTIDPQATSPEATDFSQTTEEQVLSEAHDAKNPFDGTISFNTFAPETGGKSFSLGNDIDREIGQSVDQGSTFYTISYVPAPESGVTHDYTKLAVLLDRAGVSVATRQGYFSAPPTAPVLSAKKRAKEESFDLGSAVVSKIAYTGIGLLAAPAEPSGNYVLQVDTSSMNWTVGQGGEQTADLLVLAVALDKNNKPITKSASSAVARLPADHPVSSVPFATLHVQLASSPGVERIRFLVRDQSTGKIGTADLVKSQP